MASFKIPKKLKEEIKEERFERKKVIKTYAEHYHYPISDFKNFNKLLEEQTGYETTKKEVEKLLGY